MGLFTGAHRYKQKPAIDVLQAHVKGRLNALHLTNFIQPFHVRIIHLL
jgi:hypothetical protein